MAKAVSRSANRALSLLIVKSKAYGGFNIHVVHLANCLIHLFGQLLVMVQVSGAPNNIVVLKVFNIKL